MTSKIKKIQEIQNQICELNEEHIILKKENDKVSPKVNYFENIKNKKYSESPDWRPLIGCSIIVLAIGISFLAIGGWFLITVGGIMSIPFIALGVSFFITSSFKIVSNFFKTKLNKKTKGKKINDIKNNKEQKINDKLQNNLNYKNTNLNVQEINSLDLQIQPSTSGYELGLYPLVEGWICASVAFILLIFNFLFTFNFGCWSFFLFLILYELMYVYLS